MILRVIALAVLLASVRPPASRPVVVASKPFGESYLLAEMFAQLLEARGVRVDRRPGLGATELAFRALRSGSIDVYPEYTGTITVVPEPTTMAMMALGAGLLVGMQRFRRKLR